MTRLARPPKGTAAAWPTVLPRGFEVFPRLVRGFTDEERATIVDNAKKVGAAAEEIRDRVTETLRRTEERLDDIRTATDQTAQHTGAIASRFEPPYRDATSAKARRTAARKPRKGASG